ncbi:hypothetical protein ACOME3_002875 [Neoechinorhynchus agilis]
MSNILYKMSEHRYEPIEAIREIESLKGVTLRAYQLEAVEFLLQRFNAPHGCILADEMGLGKTCTSIGFLVYLKTKARLKSALIVCPLSVLNHWRTEIQKIAPHLTVTTVCGDSDERYNSISEFNSINKDVLLTTYDIVLRTKTFLGKEWTVIIFDEAHRLKNQKSQIHTIAFNLNSKFKLLMTGTPIQNNLDELFSLLRLCSAQVFNSSDHLKNLQDDELKCVLSAFMLRRTKAQIGDSLKMVDKSEIVITHGLTELQRNLYLNILKKNIGVLSGLCQSNSLSHILTQLRKCVLHPYLFKGVEPEPFTTGEHLVRSSAKMIILDRMLNYILKHKHKCLIFSQFKPL